MLLPVPSLLWSRHCTRSMSASAAGFATPGRSDRGANAGTSTRPRPRFIDVVRTIQAGQTPPHPSNRITRILPVDPAYKHLVIGYKGFIVAELQNQSNVSITYTNASFLITGITEQAVLNAFHQLSQRYHRLVANRCTLTIPSEFRFLVTAKATPHRLDLGALERSHYCSIDVSKTGEVGIHGEYRSNTRAAQQAIERYVETIKALSRTVAVPLALLPLLVGPKGSALKRMEQTHAVSLSTAQTKTAATILVVGEEALEVAYALEQAIERYLTLAVVISLTPKHTAVTPALLKKVKNLHPRVVLSWRYAETLTIYGDSKGDLALAARHLNQVLSPHKTSGRTIKLDRRLIGAFMGEKGKYLEDIERATGVTLAIGHRESTEAYTTVAFVSENENRLQKAHRLVSLIITKLRRNLVEIPLEEAQWRAFTRYNEQQGYYEMRRLRLITNTSSYRIDPLTPDHPLCLIVTGEYSVDVDIAVAKITCLIHRAVSAPSNARKSADPLTSQTRAPHPFSSDSLPPLKPSDASISDGGPSRGEKPTP